MSRHITRDMHRRLNKFCFQLMTQNVFNKLDWPTFRTQCTNFRGTTGGNKTHSNIETPLPSNILRISSYRSDRSRLILDLVCMPVLAMFMQWGCRDYKAEGRTNITYTRIYNILPFLELDTHSEKKKKVQQLQETRHVRLIYEYFLKINIMTIVTMIRLCPLNTKFRKR